MEERESKGNTFEKEDNARGSSDGRETLTNKLRENPWIASTLVLGILVLILLVGSFTNFTGGVVSEGEAGNAIVELAKDQIGNIEITDVEKESGLYKILYTSDNGEGVVYLTLDGKNIVNGLIPINKLSGNSDSSSQDVPKSDKPVVELYVFAYCPYGTQAEKGIIPVVNSLGNKIDFRIKQIGAMHGEFEKIEAERQLCIEKDYPDKFLDYVSAFILDSSCSEGDATCVTTKVNGIYSKLGISTSKINSCMTSDGVTMYNSEVSNAKSNGVTGSPTLIINSVKVNSGRDSASYLDTICSAFNDAPEECNVKLLSTTPSPGFGSSTTASSTSAQC